MTKNVGQIDRWLRLVVGVALILVAFFTDFGASGWQHWALIVVGVIAAGTALIGTCPAYSLFGIRTCRR